MALLPLGCANNSVPEQAKQGESSQLIHAAYSLLAPDAVGDTRIYARVIVDGNPAACPTLFSSDGSPNVTTHPRHYHPDLNSGANYFPVTTCEAIIEQQTAYRIGSSSWSLNKVSLSPSSLLVFGDSGCKTSDCGGSQNPSKHFQALVHQGAALSADLILHMGDYNYRGTSQTGIKGVYDAGDNVPNDAQCGYTSTYLSQNALNSPHPDTWAYWRDDFFVPAAEILPKAPWVFTRGNHELCSRAGPAWFYFLGPGSSLPGGIAHSQCPDQGDFNQPPEAVNGHIQMIDPYFIRLPNLQLWVMDSANACDGYASNPLMTNYTKQFETLQAQIGGKNTWVLGHRPLWGNTGTDPSLTQMLQQSLKATSQKQLPPEVTLLLSGHMHSYQSLTFKPKAGRPPQIVVGNSGVSLSSSPTKPRKIKVDGKIARFNGAKKYGFLAIELYEKGVWTGVMLDEDGVAFLSCDSRDSKNVCVP